MSGLYWFCPKCGDSEPVDPLSEAEHGDEEKCITCTEDSPGMARVMTLQEAAKLAQARALRGTDLNSAVAREMLAPKEAPHG